MRAAVLFTLVVSVSAFAPASVSRVSKKSGAQEHCGALWTTTTKKNVYEIFDLSKPATEGVNIFDLGNMMLECSGFVYKFYEIRSTVRDHHEGYPKTKKFWEFWKKPKKQVNFLDPALIIQTDSSNKDHPDRNLKSVITPQAIVEFFNRNDNFNRKFLTINEKGDIVFDEDESSTDTDFEFMYSFKKYADQNVKILDYDDEFTTATGGLTYGLVVNLTKKWACVVFRGTVGNGDKLTDLNFALDTKSLFDAEGDGGKGEKPGTHAGFTKYLCSPRPNDTNERRFIDRIVSSLNFAFDLDAKNPDEDINVKPKITSDFKLYVTGHSLGGSLASLFSYHLADLKARNDESAKHIPDQITAVTFASPVVGNAPFQEKYNKLEESGFLRHYRIANKGDVISGLLPSFVRFIPLAATRDSMEFVQSGLGIDLKENGKVTITNDSTPNSFVSNGVLSGFNPFEMINLHTLAEYKSRMEAATAGEQQN